MNKERKAKKAIELGKYYTKKRDYMKGLMYFHKGISFLGTKMNRKEENYRTLAIIYEKLGAVETSKKFKVMGKMVSRVNINYDSGEPEKLVNEGHEYFGKNKFKQAIGKFLEAIDLIKTDKKFLNSRILVKEELYYDIAYSYENIGELEKSYQYIQECLCISPGYLEGKVFLGNLLLHMGRKEEGENILKEFEKLEEDIQNMPLDLDAFYGTKTS